MYSLTPRRNGAPGEPRPFSYTPLEGLDGCERLTNTEATRVTSEIVTWASQFRNESSDAFVLCDAMRDIERLFVQVWSEIDEALWRLRLMEMQPADAAEHLAVARRYLNRWQDRGGRCGNATIPN